MNESTSQLKKPSRALSKKSIAIISVIITVTIWIVWTVIVPLIRGSGVDNYSGTKKEAAQVAIDDVIRLIDNKSRWSYSFHVDEVRPINTEEKAKYCQDSPFTTNDPTNIAYYTVAVSYRQWLQFNSKTNTLVFCNRAGVYDNMH